MPDASGLMLVALVDARHTMHRFHFESGAVEHVPAAGGIIDEFSVRRDGSIHVLIESSQAAPQLVEVGGQPIVVLPRERPASSALGEDVYVDGPGGRVQSFLHRPSAGSAPYPTVFFVHGGPTSVDRDAYSPRVGALTDAGCAVVRVNYRGSTGFGRKWRDALRTRLGAIEKEDIGAVRARLEVDGVVDPARVAMAGGSWGGYVTLYALGCEAERWSVGIAHVPVADFAIAQEDQPPFMTAYDHVLFGGTLLVTASANDPRRPPRQTDVYVERLRARGCDVVYDRSDSGRVAYDNDVLVAEIGMMLDFLASRMPV